VVDRFLRAIGNAWRQLILHCRGLHDQGTFTHYVLFFIDVASRAVKIAALLPILITVDDADRAQSDRPDDGFLRGKRYLILDRDYEILRRIRQRSHPGRHPRWFDAAKIAHLNAFAERFVRSSRGMFEPHDLFGQASLQRAIRQFMMHYTLSASSGAGTDSYSPSPHSPTPSPHSTAPALAGCFNYYHRAGSLTLSIPFWIIRD